MDSEPGSGMGMQRTLTRRAFLGELLLGAAGVTAMQVLRSSGASTQLTLADQIDTSQNKTTEQALAAEAKEFEGVTINYSEVECNENTEKEYEGISIYNRGDRLGCYTVTDANSNVINRIWAKVKPNHSEGRPTGYTLDASWFTDKDVNKGFLWQDFQDRVVHPIIRAQKYIDNMIGSDTEDIFFDNAAYNIGDPRNVKGVQIQLNPINQNKESSEKRIPGIILDHLSIFNSDSSTPGLENKAFGLEDLIQYFTHEKVHASLDRNGLAFPINEGFTEAVALMLTDDVLDDLSKTFTGIFIEKIAQWRWKDRASDFVNHFLLQNNSGNREPLTYRKYAEMYGAAFIPYAMMRLAGINTNSDNPHNIRAFMNRLKEIGKPDFSSHSITYVPIEDTIAAIKDIGEKPESLPNNFSDALEIVCKGLLVEGNMPEDVEKVFEEYRAKIDKPNTNNLLNTQDLPDSAFNIEIDESTVMGSPDNAREKGWGSGMYIFPPGQITVRDMVRFQPGQKYNLGILNATNSTKTKRFETIGYVRKPSGECVNLKDDPTLIADEQGRIGRIMLVSPPGEEHNAGAFFVSKAK